MFGFKIKVKNKIQSIQIALYWSVIACWLRGLNRPLLCFFLSFFYVPAVKCLINFKLYFPKKTKQSNLSYPFKLWYAKSKHSTFSIWRPRIILVGVIPCKLHNTSGSTSALEIEEILLDFLAKNKQKTKQAKNKNKKKSRHGQIGWITIKCGVKHASIGVITCSAASRCYITEIAWR